MDSTIKINIPKLDKYGLLIWLSHAYDDNLIRHQVIEDMYDKIKDKIDSLNLELKYDEDHLYLQLIEFILKNTKV